MALPRRRALILVNRKAARGRRSVDDGLHIFDAAGIPYDLHLVDRPQSTREMIRRDGGAYDLVVIGGGDGTLSHAADALVSIGRPFGILPMGNANDLARTLGLPTDITEAFRTIALGQQKRIDLARIEDRHFFNVASVGLSVTIAKRLTCDIKQRWGVIGYLGCAWEAVRSPLLFGTRITCDGVPLELAAIQVSVGNGRYYGGGMTIVDDAAIDDSRLDAYALPPLPRWRLIAIVPALRWGTHRPLQDICSLHGTEISIETDRPMPINVDGEVIAKTPAVFRVVPRALSVFVPATASVSG